MIIPDRIYKEKVESVERDNFFCCKGNKIDQTKYVKGLNVQVNVMSVFL